MTTIRLHHWPARQRRRVPWPTVRRGRTFILNYPMDRLHLRRVYRAARIAGVPAAEARTLIVEAAETFARRAAA